MHIADFDDENISCCTAEQIEATGAELSDVNCETILSLDQFARIAEVHVDLLCNGLTSGVHDSREHAEGLAVDFVVRLSQGTRPDVRHYVPILYNVGFRGVGVYWNGTAYSFHADIGDTFRQWAWEKRPGQTGWMKRALIVDPAE